METGREVSASRVERRRYKRFQTKEETYTVLGKETGMLIDISHGGVGVHLTMFEPQEAIPSQMAIFLSRQQFYLPGLAVHQVAAKVEIPTSIFSQLPVQRLSLQFDQLTEGQRSRIEEFIVRHTLQI